MPPYDEQTQALIDGEAQAGGEHTPLLVRPPILGWSPHCSPSCLLHQL